MATFIAIDIGGTRTRIALFAGEEPALLHVERIATQSDEAPLLDRVMALIERVWPQDGKVAAIGVAAPGPLDPYRGVIFSTPNIPEWRDLPLKAVLEERFGVPVALGNDANLAALGEWRFGAGRGHHHLLYLTVSTGIGGGVIVDDRLLLGARGLGAELGHVPVMEGGPLCGCGQRGHLEALASGPAIARYVKEQLAAGANSVLRDIPHPLSAAQVAAAARQGDALARDAFERAGTVLGRAIAGFLHVFNPTIVILGGGVSRSGNLLLNPVRRAMRANVMDDHFLDHLTLTTAALGDQAGLMGALALAHSVVE